MKTEPKNTLVADQEARVRAATEFSQNLVVVAGAGTGKTGLLVERYLNMILSERGTLESTIAITFTEKAAGEMKTRVVEGLEDILLATDGTGNNPLDTRREAGRSLAWLEGTEKVPPEVLHQRAAEALDTLESAYIGTIHAFCSDLLRRHPTQTGLPPEFTIDEGFGQDLLFEEVWSDFLADELGDQPRREDLWKRILSRFLEREIEGVAEGLARDPAACDHLAREGYTGLNARETYGDRATTLLAELRQCAEEVLPGRTSPGLPELLATEIALFELFLEHGSESIRDVDSSTLPKPDIWIKGYIHKPTLKPEFKDRKEAITKTAREGRNLLKRLHKIHDLAFPDLMEGLRPFAVRFREKVQREGVLSFSDLLLMSRNLLRDHPAVRTAEGKRTSAILVDEFQDTDPLQYEIVFLLATHAEGTVADPYCAPLVPGRLFIVGDPKQSIYRFRGADISAYALATRHILEGSAPTSLVTNFRSRPEILKPLNRLFSGWIGEPEDPAVEPEYEPIETFLDPAGEHRVEMWSIQIDPDAGAEIRRRAEAKRIAFEIAGMHEGGCDYKDIALLFRALGDAPIYTRALREAGIRYVVDGGKAFTERPEVVEAFTLLKALANPADPVATLGVLRSPLGGVPDPTLVAYRKEGGPLRWTTRENHDVVSRYPLIDQTFSLLKELSRERQSLPLDRWILKTLTESSFTLLMTAFFEGAQRLANVKKLAEKAASLARDRNYTLEQTIAALEDEFSGKRVEGESPLADEGIAAVRILTIHRAKGLEYKVVMVPDLSRSQPKPESDSTVAMVRIEGKPHIGVWMQDRMKVQNTAASILDQDAVIHQNAENKRLLYVATTRAQERLILINNSPKQNPEWLRRVEPGWGYQRDKKNIDNPFPEDRATLADDTVLHRLFREPPPSHTRKTTAKDPVQDYQRFLEAREIARREPNPRFRKPSDDHRATRIDTTPEDGGPLPVDPDLARVSGTVVHQLLERWDFRTPETLTRDLDSMILHASQESGCASESLRDSVDSIVQGFLNSDLPGYLGEVDVLGREVPILFRDPNTGVTVHGYADLIYAHSGTIHVADYKTDNVTIAEHAESYRDQLTDYATAVAGAMNLEAPPTRVVLFLRTGTRVLLPSGPASP